MGTGKFVWGIVAGSVFGMAASVVAIDQMCPGVKAKMMRNGKKVIGRYKKQMNF